MISELRRSAFDTDLLLPGQSCQDLSQPSSPVNIQDQSNAASIINPRRVEALQRDYERLGFQVNRIEFLWTRNNFCLFRGSSRAHQRFSKGSTRYFIITESLLLLYSTKEWFHTRKFIVVNCGVLRHRTFRSLVFISQSLFWKTLVKHYNNNVLLFEQRLKWHVSFAHYSPSVLNVNESSAFPVEIVFFFFF